VMLLKVHVFWDVIHRASSCKYFYGTQPHIPEDLNHEVKYMFYFMLIATFDMLFEAVSFSRSKSFPLVWLYQIL
jgi:hypothetical protein